MNCRTALITVLDQIDYTNGACGMTEMVGAVLPKEIIALARKAIAEEGNKESHFTSSGGSATNDTNSAWDAIHVSRR